MQELRPQQDIKTVRPLSVRMIFEDNHNWDAYSLANKAILRENSQLKLTHFSH